MSARVVPAYANAWDTVQPFMVECLECGIEWGWTRDGDYAPLQVKADEHNRREHPQPT